MLNGKSFGNVGPYEKLWGTAHFAVDPSNPRNRVIADIDLAPRNREGKIEFSADLFILRPKDPKRGNGVVFFDVINRGRFRLLSTFSDAEAADDPTTEAHFGDQSLLLQGYTLVAVGWQFDVEDELIGFKAPIATQNGQPIRGWLRQWFLPTKPSDSFEWTGGNSTKGYVPVDLNSAEYRLTARVGHFAARRLIPRADWQFGRLVDGRHVADPDYVTLKGGFQPGITYEIAYEFQNPPIVGLGLAAVRDMASAMKYDPAIVAPGRYAYMYGSSQTGRTLRTLVHGGFTIDERERKVFDAAFIKTGGGSIGRFNERFALVNSLGVFTETQFPFQYQVTTDPVTGKRDGLGLRIPAGLEPKIFTFDSGSEYLGQGSSRRPAARVDRRHRRFVRCPQRADVLHCRIATRLGNGAGDRQRRSAEEQHPRLRLGPARLDGGTRFVGARRQGAAAQPAPEILGRHDGPAPPAQIPRRFRA